MADTAALRFTQGAVLRPWLALGWPNAVAVLAQTGAGMLEFYYVGRLGADPLAGLAMVFPLLMFMQMMSNGSVGGAVSSAVARALGGQRQEEADALTLHVLLIAVLLGLAFTAAMGLGGRFVLTSMGGGGAALEAALAYARWIFGGAVLIWVYNLLSGVARGAGHVRVPAVISLAGLVLLLPLSPALIFGWGPLPALGAVGGAVALLIYYVLGCIVLMLYLARYVRALRPRLLGVRLRWPLFRAVMQVGVLGSVSALTANLAIAIGTYFASQYGSAAIAGYGAATRLEYLLITFLFGISAPLVPMVGVCIGAGLRARAVRIATLAASVVFSVTTCVGLAAALWAREWVALFGDDARMLQAGTDYLRIVGPTFGFLGVGLCLYFASQGAGRLQWPVLANLARLLVVALGGAAVALSAGSAQAITWVQAAGLVTYGALMAWSFAGGAWFGRPRFTRLMPALSGRAPAAGG